MSNYQEGSRPYSEGTPGGSEPHQEPSPGGASAYQGGSAPHYETAQFGTQGSPQQWDQQGGYQAQQGPQGQAPQGPGFGYPGNRMGSSGRSSLKVRSTFKTTEFWVLVVVALGVLLAAAVTDDNVDGQAFGALDAWRFVTWLAIAYIVSRGLTKFSGNEPERGDDHH